MQNRLTCIHFVFSALGTLRGTAIFHNIRWVIFIPIIFDKDGGIGFFITCSVVSPSSGCIYWWKAHFVVANCCLSNQHKHHQHYFFASTSTLAIRVSQLGQVSEVCSLAIQVAYIGAIHPPVEVFCTDMIDSFMTGAMEEVLLIGGCGIPIVKRDQETLLILVHLPQVVILNSVNACNLEAYQGLL